MNSGYYKQGLKILHEYAKGTEWFEDFLSLENELRENLDDILPEDPNTYRQRQGIIKRLNSLCLKYLKISFNELCEGKTILRIEDTFIKGSSTIGVSSVLGSVKDRWAVLVGVPKYKDNSYKLLLPARKDATAVRDCLCAGGFVSDRVRVLVDNPTQGEILNALKTTAQMTQPDDLLLFYYSGHGEMENDNSYLIAHDSNQSSLNNTAILLSSVKEIVKQAPARRKIMLLDACHAGSSALSKAAKPMSAAFIKRVFDEAQGLVILASCTQDQKSWIHVESGHSLFTYHLLQALKGNADFDNKGFVTMQDINRYITDKVKLEAFASNKIQTPTIEMNVQGGDIPCVNLQ